MGRLLHCHYVFLLYTVLDYFHLFISFHQQGSELLRKIHVKIVVNLTWICVMVSMPQIHVKLTSILTCTYLSNSDPWWVRYVPIQHQNQSITWVSVFHRADTRKPGSFLPLFKSAIKSYWIYPYVWADAINNIHQSTLLSFQGTAMLCWSFILIHFFMEGVHYLKSRKGRDGWICRSIGGMKPVETLQSAPGHITMAHKAHYKVTTAHFSSA